MTFTILGTSAAEGWPALYCTCAACEEARRLGGKNLRRRAAYQLGDTIHIDLGPDTYAQMLQFGLRYDRLQHLLITHSHADHLSAAELMYRHPGFAVLPEDAMLTVHGNQHVREKIWALAEPLKGTLEDCRARFESVRLFQPVTLSEGVTATAILADHAGEEVAVNWLLERDGRALLQGNDTGWWPEESWQFLTGRPLHVVVLECTYGPNKGQHHHLGAQEVLQVRDHLDKLGALAPGARVVVTHLSHHSRWLHHQYEDFFAPEGIEVAYDGMQIEL